MERKCGKCLEKLNIFINYVPGMGESCTNCLMALGINELANAKDTAKTDDVRLHARIYSKTSEPNC